MAKLQKENSDMKVKLATMSDDSEKLGGLKMKLQMLEEELRWEKSALESANEKTGEDHAVITKCNALMARASNLEQLLARPGGSRVGEHRLRPCPYGQ